MGLLDNIKKIVGSSNSAEALLEDNTKQLIYYKDKVKQINALEDEYEAFTKVLKILLSF